MISSIETKVTPLCHKVLHNSAARSRHKYKFKKPHPEGKNNQIFDSLRATIEQYLLLSRVDLFTPMT